MKNSKIIKLSYELQNEINDKYRWRLNELELKQVNILQNFLQKVVNKNKSIIECFECKKIIETTEYRVISNAKNYHEKCFNATK